MAANDRRHASLNFSEREGKGTQGTVSYWPTQLGWEKWDKSALDPLKFKNRAGSPLSNIRRGQAGRALIHLQAADHTKRQPVQSAVNVFVTDVDALYQELKSRGGQSLE